MCDYSQFAAQTRLANKGDQLILYRFKSGSKGFAPASEIRLELERKQQIKGFWSRLCGLLTFQDSIAPTAVCIPPGARLLLSNVPQEMQSSLGIRSSEIAVFTETSARSYAFRDALVLPNKRVVLLQDVSEGVQAFVLSTSSEDEWEIPSDEDLCWAGLTGTASKEPETPYSLARLIHF